jgi:t-SNARE complex subunit (syntaxin)
LLVLRRYSKAIISLRKKKLEFTYLIVIAMLYVIIIIVLRLRFLSVNNYTRHLYKVL